MLWQNICKRKMQQVGSDVVCKSILQVLILQQCGVMRKGMKECLHMNAYQEVYIPKCSILGNGRTKVLNIPCSLHPWILLAQLLVPIGGQDWLSQTDTDVTCCMLNAWHCKAACMVDNAGLICSLNQHASWITMQAAYCMAGVLLSAGGCLVVVV